MYQYCTINMVLICGVIILLTICLIIRFRTQIVRFMKKNQICRFLVNILVPFVVPLTISVLTILDGSKEEWTGLEWAVLVLICVAALNSAFQFGFWLKEKKEKDLRWENNAAGYAFNNMFEVHKSKSSQLRSAYHNGLRNGMLTDADIPYNTFEQIRRITWEFCRTISQITNIPTKNLEDAFIYHYVYEGAEKDGSTNWKWIVGRGTRFDKNLSDFVCDNESAFHNMISNNIASVFCNDKRDAAKHQCYKYSYKDFEYDRVGSFFGAKIAFSGNDALLCEGIIFINSYGKKFLDDFPEYTEKEMSHMILDGIFPCFRYMLTTELAMLYFRHQGNSQGENGGNNQGEQAEDLDAADYQMDDVRTKCIISASKRIWRKR